MAECTGHMYECSRCVNVDGCSVNTKSVISILEIGWCFVNATTIPKQQECIIMLTRTIIIPENLVLCFKYIISKYYNIKQNDASTNLFHMKI